MAGSAAVAVCLGLLVSACGSGESEGGFVNDGAAGPDKGAPTAPVPPEDKVSLHPLRQSPSASESPGGPDASETAGTETDSDSGEEATETPGQDGQSGGTGGSDSPSSGPGDGSSGTPAPDEPGGPAQLTVGEHKRAAADKRRCERVSFNVHNTGGSPVTSGTVTFSTHVIGVIGTDYGAVETSQSLRAPVEAGERTEQTYTVCLPAWRVMLGSVETRGVEVSWE